MTPTIRRAEPDDGPALSRLAEQLGYPNPPQVIRDGIAALSALDRRDLFVAVDAADRAIGYANVGPMDVLFVPGAAELHEVVVDELHRGTGVGRALVEACAAAARRRGHTVLYVRSNAVREAAHRFYLTCGFQDVKLQRVFRRSL